MNPEVKDHWNNTYTSNDITKLGWYEDAPEPSLQLIKECNLAKDARILNVGTGTSTLIDELLALGYQNLIASDISNIALEKLQSRLGSNKEKVTWIVDDLTQAKKLPAIEEVELWHDRAVLHFFTSEKDQNNYFSLVNKLVKPKGYAIIATFNTEGALKCSGLDVLRYNKEMLIEKLKDNFKLIKSFNFSYTMPSGDTRPYIYTLFKKTN